MTQDDQIVQHAFLRALRDALHEASQSGADSESTGPLLALSERVLARLVAAPVSRALAPITIEPMQRYLDEHFKGDTPRALSLRELPGGRSKRTILLTLDSSPRLPTDIVLRQDKPGSAQGTSVCEEYPVMAALHEQGVAVAKPLWLEPSSSGLGPPFLAMSFAPGAAPGDYWSAGSASPMLGEALADALARLHGADATRIWPQASRSASQCVAQMIDACEMRWRTSGAAVSESAASAFQWIRRQSHCIEGEAVPIHGDVHFGNLLATGARIDCLTDWEFAHAGHPAEDLAFCRASVESIMTWEKFLRCYRDSGGRQITEGQLQIFSVWSCLRNLGFASGLRQSVLQGAVVDLTGMMIVIDALPRLQHTLAATMSQLSIN